MEEKEISPTSKFIGGGFRRKFPKCETCKWFDERQYKDYICAAFPEGIPFENLYGEDEEICKGKYKYEEKRRYDRWKIREYNIIKKVKVYLMIAMWIIVFYAKQHIYITGALIAITIRSVWGAVSEKRMFWLICPVAMVVIIAIIRCGYRKIDEFASPGVKARHLRERIHTRNQLEKFILDKYDVDK